CDPGGISMYGKMLAALTGVVLCAGVANAQSPDPALANLNACVSGPSGGSQADIMKKLNPAMNDPDRVAWCFFVYVNSLAASGGNNDALFETWASDDDTFQPNPSWPGPTVTAAKPLRRPILPHLAAQSRGGTLTPFVLPL